MSTVLSPDRLFRAMDDTWCPARIRDADGWRLREGHGGGKRVSAASRVYPEAKIADAEAAMRDMGQIPLFMIQPGDEDLDKKLAMSGYEVVDPVTIYTSPAETLACDVGTHKVVFCDLPLAIMAELWAQGGVGPARLDVMGRVRLPKTYVLARAGDRPAGVAFVAADGPVCMVHALEVAPPFRKQGIGQRVLRAAAGWATAQGCTHLALAVTDANMPANALYSRLGMTPLTRYHYRRKAT